jgi:hypothetical protein
MTPLSGKPMSAKDAIRRAQSALHAEGGMEDLRAIAILDRVLIGLNHIEDLTRLMDRVEEHLR